MINFCHISPTAYLPLYTKRNGAHLILAHLVESDPVYRDFYANLADGKTKIMDNGAYEMFKAGRPMYPSDKLIDMGKACKADYIVMSDYPKQSYKKTERAATDMMNKLGENNFLPFFCPQSELGDMEGLLNSIEWAVEELRIGMIGISILNAPVALGIEEQPHHHHTFVPSVLDANMAAGDAAYRMQRFLARWKLFREMEKRGILAKLNKENQFGNMAGGKRGTSKIFHCLGMVDGPNEIDLLRDYHKYIYSWDSSAAVWAGLHGIEFDKSPTGLRNGKFEAEVDFSDRGRPESMVVHRNMAYINRLCETK